MLFPGQINIYGASILPLQCFLVAYLLQPCDVLRSSVLELGAASREDKAVTVLLEPVLVGLVVGELGVGNVVVPDL